jgi:sulfite reductase (NADPH) hemoprotein beta-component
MVPQDLKNFADARDIDEFVDGLRRFERGEMPAEDFRRFRLARGTYGQRQSDVNMIRIKIPQGIMHATQLERVGDLCEKYSRGFGHVTTRQNIQIHMVKLSEAAEIQRQLAEVGLTTKEACGNTVRNITGCPLAGTCSTEAFDITPYAEAVTRSFLRNPICQDLPRKFKVAFSGCATDCAQGAINDVGLQGRVQDGVRGFRVAVGGGLSTSPEDAHLLYEFLPADRLTAVIEAVIRVFDRTGNRKNKARARLKYVIRKRGFDGFRAEFDKELAAIRADGREVQPIEVPAPRALPTLEMRGSPAAKGTPPAGLLAFRASNVLAQRQVGYVTVVVRLVRGDLTGAQFRALAEVARSFGDGTARLTNDQNAVLRFIPQTEVRAVYEALAAADLARAGARTIADVTACPGADTCNLAVTQSRELASSLSEALEAAEAAGSEAVSAASALDIKISGCPNSCGQHHVAAIGFHGTMKRVGDKTVPEYQLHLGGGIDGNGATFGRQIVKVPARRSADALLRLLELYLRDRKPAEPALEFFRRVDEAAVKAAVADLHVDEATASPEDFHDLGEEKDFKVMIGAGECAT